MVTGVGTDRQRQEGRSHRWKWKQDCGSWGVSCDPTTMCTHHQRQKAGIYAELDLHLGRTCGRDSDPDWEL